MAEYNWGSSKVCHRNLAASFCLICHPCSLLHISRNAKIFVFEKQIPIDSYKYIWCSVPLYYNIKVILYLFAFNTLWSCKALYIMCGRWLSVRTLAYLWGMILFGKPCCWEKAGHACRYSTKLGFDVESLIVSMAQFG